MSITTKDLPQIIDSVRRHLEAKDRDRHWGLRLQEKDYRLEDDWLYLIVTTTGEGIRPSEYAKVLDEVEKELSQEGTDNILLVPALDD